jgi:hypothetical protein
MACRLHTDLSLMLRKMIYGIVLLLLLVIPFSGTFADNSSSNAGNAGNSSDVQNRLNDLQQRQDEMFKQLESEQRKVQTFIDDRLYFGGFFESAVTGIWGNNTGTQFSVTPQNLALNLAADLNDSLRFNSQVLFTLSNPLQNPDNDSNAPAIGLPVNRQFGGFTTSTSISQAYIEYGSTPEIAFQIGRGYTPFGIAFQQRDLVLFRRRGGPQMINANFSGDVVIAAGSWTGIHIGGTSRLTHAQWGYDLYSVAPASNASSLGGGARLWTDVIPLLTIGFSTQEAKRHGYTYEAVGADAKMKVGRAGFDSEYAANYTASGVGVSRSYYIEPYYTFFGEKIVLYGVADYLDDPVSETIGLTETSFDPYQKWELGGGINWLPYTFTRFRIGLLYNDYVGANANDGGANRNYFSLDLSAGVEF